MNRINKARLTLLAEKCGAALRDERQQSFNVFRGDMWAILSAAHELRKRGVLENELLDALDLKAGRGPTALSMVAADRDALRKRLVVLESALQGFVDAFNGREIDTGDWALMDKALAALSPKEPQP